MEFEGGTKNMINVNVHNVSVGRFHDKGFHYAYIDDGCMMVRYKDDRVKIVCNPRPKKGCECKTCEIWYEKCGDSSSVGKDMSSEMIYMCVHGIKVGQFMEGGFEYGCINDGYILVRYMDEVIKIPCDTGVRDGCKCKSCILCVDENEDIGKEEE